MGRAEDIFNRICEKGEEAIKDFINDRQSEDLFLDFKRSADKGSKKRLHQNDRQNMAKAISGFGNSEGGIIIWGIDCPNQPEMGDVPSDSDEFLIHNPKRFLSWLEGVVSGCTVPPHSDVRHHAIVTSSKDKGYVVTYIAKSHLAPHQCLKPLQYYIRAGSDFVPTPHAVLAGMFGRQPQPDVYHGWVLRSVGITSKTMAQPTQSVRLELYFVLNNRGPSLARDLYVSTFLDCPKGPTQGRIFSADPSNWSVSSVIDMMITAISNDSFKLAPGGLVQPIYFRFIFVPPFESGLRYKITYGHRNSPVQTVGADIEASTIQEAFSKFIQSGGNTDLGQTFIKTVMSLKNEDV